MRAKYRAVAASGVVALCTVGMGAMGAGSALAASTTPAALPAASDIALDSCNMTVGADGGNRLVVSAKTMLAPQMKELGNIPLVGPLLVAVLDPALSTLTLPPFVVQPDRAPLTGAAIADSLVTALGPLLPPPVVEPLRTAVTQACLVTVVPKAALSAPQAPVAAQAAPPAVSAASLSTPVASSSNLRQAPRYTYSDLTAVSAGGRSSYPVNLAPTLPPPSYAGYGVPAGVTRTLPGTGAPVAAPAPMPQFAPLALPTTSAPATESPAVRAAAGQSEVVALPAAPDAASRVPGEAAIAALLLSLTTAALVRTWVLRRATV